PPKAGDPIVTRTDDRAKSEDYYRSAHGLRPQAAAAVFATDLAGDRLCLWTAPGGDVAGVDSGLRAARAPSARRSSGQALSGQWTDAGSVAGAGAGARAWTFLDAAWDAAASADSHSGQRVGGRQGGVEVVVV